MTQKHILLLILCFFTVFSACTLNVKAEEAQTDLAILNGCHSVDGGMSFLGQNQLVENIKSAFLFETNSETLMYAWNADAQMYPASLVKIMTALLVIENGQLSDTVIVTQSALDTVSDDAISVDLQEGENLTVEELLYCLMVYSANDAAAVLAEYVSGSQADFVALMNSRAQELGCTGTNYTNPHGLHNDLQLSTARDTCRILQAALKHDIFRTIFGTVYYTVEATNLHEKRNLYTNNHLMNTDTVSIHYDGRVTGGRAGTTADGYQCVATTSESGNMELICVVMGSKTTYLDDGYSIESFGGFPETSALLDLGYTGYSRQQIIFNNQILRQQPVVNGDSDVFVAAFEDFSAVLPETITFDQLTFRYADAPGSSQAPIKKGQNMAALQVWYGSMCVAQTDVFAMNDVPVAFTKTANTVSVNTYESGWATVIIIIAVLAAASGVSVLLLRRRSGQKGKRRKHHRRIRRRR